MEHSVVNAPVKHLFVSWTRGGGAEGADALFQICDDVLARRVHEHDLSRNKHDVLAVLARRV